MTPNPYTGTFILSMLLLGSAACRGVTTYPDGDYGPCGQGLRVEDQANSPFGEPLAVTYDRIANFDAEITWAAAGNPLPTTWSHRYTDEPVLSTFASQSPECTEEVVLDVPLGQWIAPISQESRLRVVWEDVGGAPNRKITGVTEDPDAIDWVASQVDFPRSQTPWGVQIFLSGDAVWLTLVTDEEEYIGEGLATLQGTVVYP